MRGLYLALAVAGFVFPLTGRAAEAVAKSRAVCRMEDVRVSGHLGEKMSECLINNVKATDGSYLAAIFQKHEGTSDWRTEFWGTWSSPSSFPRRQ